MKFNTAWGISSGCIVPTMHIQAVSIGEAVPCEPFEAEIHSVFESAVNLRLENEDRLITILVTDHYELPQGIRISEKNIPLQSLTVGLRAALRGGILRFGSFPLTIDIRSSSIWFCRLPEFHVNMNTSYAQTAFSTAWALLNDEQQVRRAEIVANNLISEGMGSLLSRRMQQPVKCLIDAAAELNGRKALEAAERIIGLGPGVTPSGDDILIGFLAGLWCMTGQTQKQFSFIHSFGDALMKIAKQTNEISRTYLAHATRGQFSSSLTDLAEAFANGGDVAKAVRAAMNVGHSSGMDSVTGFLFGLRVRKMENQSGPAPLSA